ncbi:MAG: cyclase [Acidimicrobiia bacterium]|nr:cyclase [Acidimicrobiia bacterium]
MYVLAINHAVADYDKWKAGYDAMPPTTMGAKFSRVNRSVDDPNLVTVVSGYESLETLQSFMGDPKLKEAMQAAGVLGEPRIEIYEEVEALMA